MTATIAEHKAASHRQKLATAIGQVVKNFTMQNPDMSQDEVIRLNAMLDQIEVARLEENRERYGAA